MVAVITIIRREERWYIVLLQAFAPTSRASQPSGVQPLDMSPSVQMANTLTPVGFLVRAAKMVGLWLLCTSIKGYDFVTFANELTLIVFVR